MGGANLKELQMQYGVQVDVVTQLEARVKQQLNSGQATAPQIIKLKRDFGQVQARVQSLKLDVERMERMAKSAAASGYNGTSSSTAQSQGNAASLQQMQMQMQQDVSAGITAVFSYHCFYISSHLYFLTHNIVGSFRANNERTRARNHEHQSRNAPGQRNLQRFGSYCRNPAGTC